MPKRNPVGLKKHTLNLYEGDYDRLQTIAGDGGASMLARKIIRNFLEKMESGRPIDIKVSALEE